MAVASGSLDPKFTRRLKRWERDMDSFIGKARRAWLVWTAENERMAIYGEVHQEGLGKMPQRQWMHLQSELAKAAVVAAIEQAVKVCIARFNNGIRGFGGILAQVKRDQKKSPTIAQAVIATATLGHGPDGVPYRKYSTGYQKRIDKAGGSKRFLRGIDHRGRRGGMLDEKRFTIEVEG